MTRNVPRAALHMIGNAHIDPVWLWNWQEGFQEIKATYRSALDRLSEDPDFIFTCSSAAHLAWIEENEPELFEEIKVRVVGGPLGAGRRLVGAAGLSPSRRRGLRASGPLRSALLCTAASAGGPRGLQPRFVRPRRHPAADSEKKWAGVLHLHAPRPTRAGAAQPPVRLAGQ